MKTIYAEQVREGDTIVVGEPPTLNHVQVAKVGRKRSGIHMDIVINDTYTFWEGDNVGLVSRSKERETR